MKGKPGTSEYIGMVLKGFEIIEYIPAKDGHNPKMRGKCVKCGREIVRAKSGFLQERARITCPCNEIYSHHGKSYTRLYRTWQNMKRRCYNENNKWYHLYGGRGIKVCDEWLEKDGFLNFYNWAMASGYSDDLSIDRIDGNGNYEPSNCRWATPHEQNMNREITIYAEINGIRKTLVDWCEEYGIGYGAVKSRLNRGWDIENAITQPLGTRRKAIEKST